MLPLPIDLPASLRPLVASAQDPTVRLGPHELVRASWTPAGPATLQLRRDGDRRFTATAFGAGAAWALDAAPRLLGADDDVSAFDARHHPLVNRAHRRHPGLRIVRSDCVWDVLVATILAQRVTSAEAARTWTRLVRRYGTPAPGPHGLLLPPTPETIAGMPAWAWRELGVEAARARNAAVAVTTGPLTSGKEQATGAYAGALAERGHDVTLIGLSSTAASTKTRPMGDGSLTEIRLKAKEVPRRSLVGRLLWTEGTDLRLVAAGFRRLRMADGILFTGSPPFLIHFLAPLRPAWKGRPS